MTENDDTTSDGALVQYWIEKLAKEEKCHEAWRKAASAAEGEYYNARKDGKDVLFNLFYSTTNTLHARLYSKPPVPDVRRRYDAAQKGDPMAEAGRQAATMVERALGYTIDLSLFDAHAHRIVDDFLIAGAGVPWVEYEAKTSADPATGLPSIDLQRLHLKHTPWSRFHWEPGKDWEDTDWVARDFHLTAAEIKAQFGVEPDSGGTKRDKDAGDKSREKYAATYRVTEVWYKPKRTVYIIGWDFDAPLEVRQDALALEGFFPCPRPMFANLRGDRLEPTPDYVFFQSSYDYINRLVNRIHAITAQIKASGFYDAGLPELGNVAKVEDGTFVSVANLAERLQMAGGAAVFDRVVAELPIAQKAAVLQQLQQALAVEKQRLDEATGIADVVMGQSSPSETATAQQIKSNWAGLRLTRKMGEVSRALRDTFRIMAEIMAEHFTPESWYLHTGLQPEPAVLALLKTDVGRNLAIDVETDSTVALDDEAEKQQRIEFLNYVTPFLQQMIPLVQGGQMPADLGASLLKFAVGSFKHGRELEEVIDGLPDGMAQLQALQQQLQQMQQQAMQAQQQAQMAGQQAQQLGAQLQQSEQARQQAEMKAAAKAVDPQMAQLEIAERQIGVEKARIELAATAGKAQTEAVKGAAESQTAASIAQVVTGLQAAAEQQGVVLTALTQAAATLSAATGPKPRTVRKRITLNKGPDGKPASADVVEVME